MEGGLATDNNWHDAIAYKHLDTGIFAVAKDVDEAEKDPRIKKRHPDGTLNFCDCKFNWNRGQPILDFGDFKVAVMDLVPMPK